MATHIALLRAINVGGHTVPMARLRALFEELGCTAVETLIASGNVHFSVRGSQPSWERRIAAHLEASLGFPVATFLRSPGELDALCDALPAGAAREGTTTYVGFLRTSPDRLARTRLAAMNSEVDRFTVHGREVFWLSRTTIGRSAISNRQLEAALGQPTTLRNLTTLRRILAVWGPGA